MLVKITLTLLALAISTSALQITSPSNSSGWTTQGSQVIEWDVSAEVFFPPPHLSPNTLPLLSTSPPTTLDDLRVRLTTPTNPPVSQHRPLKLHYPTYNPFLPEQSPDARSRGRHFIGILHLHPRQRIE